MEEEAHHQAAAAGSDVAQWRRPAPHLRVPAPDRRRRRRPSPSEPDFDALRALPTQLPVRLEFEVVRLEAPPRKRARIPASAEDILQEVTAAAASGDDETECCAICLQDLFHAQEDQEHKNLRAMPCSHVFHQHCILEWLRRKTVCPLCRHQLMMMPTTAPPSPSPTEEEDEDYVASLGDDAVIIRQEEAEVDVDVGGNMERIRMMRAIMELLMRLRARQSARSNRPQT